MMPLGFGWASAQTLRSTWHAKRFVNAPGAFTARGKANSHAENAENAERYRKHSVPTGVFCGLEAGRPEIALPLLVNAPNAPNPSELFYNFKATFPVAWA